MVKVGAMQTAKASCNTDLHSIQSSSTILDRSHRVNIAFWLLHTIKVTYFCIRNCKLLSWKCDVYNFKNSMHSILNAKSTSFY